MTAPQFILLLAGVCLLLSLGMSVGWLLWRSTKNSGWVDSAWTFSVGTAGALSALGAIPAGNIGARPWLVAALVAAWSWRLGLHISRRNLTRGDDPRYAKLVRDWGTDAGRQMFILPQKQAIVSIPLCMSVALAGWNPSSSLRWQDMLATAVILVGIAGEWLSDRQLKAFMAQPDNRGRVCDVGLWRHSRHPNYFFEWFAWLAYPIFSVDLTGIYPVGWLALLGPLCMYWLLTRVSGVPPLEEYMLDRHGDAFRAYQRRTNAFFPGPAH